ncbi:ribosome modulation factor [Burkholderia gladioli]|uniref:ribosome modulation factor n=1 Tax=Burkholderia gladioli TaxID=28095 RepID=UPI00163FF850|nr:ribosome modulation factor [Burkholderia gladioli]
MSDKLSDAYREGYERGRNGGSCMRCPYYWMHPSYDDWMRGYKDGFSHFNYWRA